MAYKVFELETIGACKVYKNRQSRSIRLTITPLGELRVTQPTWLPYAAGVAFAKARAEWITAHKPARPQSLTSGHKIGKTTQLRIERTLENGLRSRQTGNILRVYIPGGYDPFSLEVQNFINRAATRALKREAETLLPKRVNNIASTTGFRHNGIMVRQLRSRWGSCSSKQEITLNLYLMQLPWELIDYVIMHELVHTKHMDHGGDFWNEFLRHEPNAKLLRKRIRNYRPFLRPSQV